MGESDTWRTRRQKLIELLSGSNHEISLRFIFIELEYSNKRNLIEDINSIDLSLRNSGKKIAFLPASCIACGFQFKHSDRKFKIPSKCPNCRNERIEWPYVQILTL